MRGTRCRPPKARTSHQAYRWLFALALSGTVFGSLTASSQAQDIDERMVAGAVQSFYNQTRGVQANFHQTYYHRLYDRYDRSRGRVIFAKPGKMRWNYSRPNGKIITSNGQTLRVFEPGDEGERGQCFERAVSEDQLPQAFSFLTGTGRLEENFHFRLLDAARQGYSDGYVLELRPREPTPHYERILFYVMRQDGRPSGIVRRVLIVDASGNRNRFDFSDFEWNPGVNARTFDHQPPGGITCTTP